MRNITAQKSFKVKKVKSRMLKMKNSQMGGDCPSWVQGAGVGVTVTVTAGVGVRVRVRVRVGVRVRLSFLSDDLGIELGLTVL